MSSNQKPRHNNRSRHSNKPNNRGRNQGGRGGHKGPSNKPSQQPMNATRQVDSHGPTGKQRGNVKQLYDRYKELAAECRTRDRQTSEALGQFAHHYYSLYSEFSAAEAAIEVKREEEKERNRRESVENEAKNVVIKEDVGSNNDDKAEAVKVAEVQKMPEMPEMPEMIVAEEVPFLASPAPEKPKAKPRKRAPKAEPEQKEQQALELPLGAVDVDAKPKRKPAARKPRKVKEEVAE